MLFIRTAVISLKTPKAPNILLINCAIFIPAIAVPRAMNAALTGVIPLFNNPVNVPFNKPKLAVIALPMIVNTPAMMLSQLMFPRNVPISFPILSHFTFCKNVLISVNAPTTAIPIVCPNSVQLMALKNLLTVLAIPSAKLPHAYVVTNP